MDAGTNWTAGRATAKEGVVATAILSCNRAGDGLVRRDGKVVTEVAATGVDSARTGSVYERHLSARAE